VELKKFSKEKKKASSRILGFKDTRTWALKAKEKTSVLKNQSKNKERNRKRPKQSSIHL
jgi:hypothetical protein